MYSAESTTAYKDVKGQFTTQKLTVSSTTQSKMISTQTRVSDEQTPSQRICSIIVLVTVNNDITSRGYTMGDGQNTDP